MKACPHCRAEYEENLIYCTKDGSPLIDTEAPTADDIEIDTYVKKSDIPAVKPIDGLETQAWDADEFAQTEYETRDEEEVFDTYRETENAEFAETYREADDPDEVEEEFEEKREESVVYQKPIESEDKRSYLGLIIGALALFGVLILGAALIGGFLYYQSQNQIETASTDANQETNSSSDFPIDDANENASDQENSNTEEYDSDGDLLTDFDTTTGSSRDSDSGKDRAKDKDKDRNSDKEKEKTSTQSDSRKNESTSKDSTKTREKDTRSSTPSPTPERRTPPTPQKTPRKTPTPARKTPTRISGGVVNGKAVRLPVPAYPSAARAARISGKVNVQVVISKSGSVMSARAVGGHPLLRSAAVSAARRAKFRPTMLSGRPVEVSGVIVYNFRP